MRLNTNSSTQFDTFVNSSVRSDAGVFVRKTYGYFAYSLVVSAIFAAIGVLFLAPLLMNLVASLVILAIEVGLIFYLNRSDISGTAATVALGVFAAFSGLSLTGILAVTLAYGGMAIIAQALFLSALAFVGLSVFAFTTKKDFSVFGKALFIALLVLVGASILNLFLHVSWLSLGISCAAALIFSFYIIYDTQNIITGRYMTPVQGAIALYLDFINLFVSLLNILRSIER